MVGRDEEDFLEISAFFDSRDGQSSSTYSMRSLGPDDVLVSMCFPHHRLVYQKVSLAEESDPGDGQPWKLNNYFGEINIKTTRFSIKLT